MTTCTYKVVCLFNMIQFSTFIQPPHQREKANKNYQVLICSLLQPQPIKRLLDQSLLNPLTYFHPYSLQIHTQTSARMLVRTQARLHATQEYAESQ